jgi:hypothetical protein
MFFKTFKMAHSSGLPDLFDEQHLLGELSLYHDDTRTYYIESGKLVINGFEPIEPEENINFICTDGKILLGIKAFPEEEADDDVFRIVVYSISINGTQIVIELYNTIDFDVSNIEFENSNYFKIVGNLLYMLDEEEFVIINLTDGEITKIPFKLEYNRIEVWDGKLVAFLGNALVCVYESGQEPYVYVVHDPKKDLMYQNGKVYLCSKEKQKLIVEEIDVYSKNVVKRVSHSILNISDITVIAIENDTVFGIAESRTLIKISDKDGVEDLASSTLNVRVDKYIQKIMFDVSTPSVIERIPIRHDRSKKKIVRSSFIYDILRGVTTPIEGSGNKFCYI